MERRRSSTKTTESLCHSARSLSFLRFVVFVSFSFVLPNHGGVTAFVMPARSSKCSSSGVIRRGGMGMMSAESQGSPDRGLPKSRLQFLGSLAGGAVALALPLAALADPPLEKFKPGEICVERNLNGSCSKFGVSETSTEQMPAATKKAVVQDEPESELITTLKKRSLENKVINDEEVATKTFVNGQAGLFGPFSRYVPVKHRDTGKFELIIVSELDEMRKEGLIENKGGTEYFTQGVKDEGK